MVSSALICGALILGGPAPDGPAIDSSKREAYEAAAAAAGHDATAQVRLALWCEAHGLTAERLKHLSRAVLDQPSNALTRALLGLVRYQGRGSSPKAVAKRVRDDTDRQALIHEYLDRRAQAAGTPDDQIRLAAWCESETPEGAGDWRTTRGAPARSRARPSGSIWATSSREIVGSSPSSSPPRNRTPSGRSRPTALADEAGEAARGPAEQGRREAGRGPSRRWARSPTPLGLGSIWAVFVGSGVWHQMSAIQMFGQIDGPSASNALAAMAIFSPCARGARTRNRDADAPRSPRHRRAAHRPGPQAAQVRGAACAEARVPRASSSSRANGSTSSGSTRTRRPACCC